MTEYCSADTIETVSTLLAGPQWPEKEFVHSGATFAKVYAMASWLRTTLDAPQYRGKPVCLAAENKALIAAALLASLAGGPSLLLPYAFSRASLVRMQETIAYTVAITDAARAFPSGVNCLCPPETLAGGQLEATQPDLDSELLHLFTGGSTGTPQLWTKTGMNILAETISLARHFKVNSSDCIVATISPYHIYGLLFSIALPLVSGASVLATTPSFPDEIATAVRDSKATILTAAPPHYRALREKELKATDLRWAFSSAGILELEDNVAFQQHNALGIVEIYGSTETGGIAFRNRSIGEESFTAFPPIDWKIQEELLAVRSTYISPEVSLDNDGFFLTADRVEKNGENRFEFLGRADSITKVGGKRVDLREITVCIKSVPEVKDCVVLSLPDNGGRENRVVALVQGDGVDVDAIRKRIANTLEPYARPRLIKVIDEIPMTGNSKYDHQAIVRLLTT